MQGGQVVRKLNSSLIIGWLSEITQLAFEYMLERIWHWEKVHREKHLTKTNKQNNGQIENYIYIERIERGVKISSVLPRFTVIACGEFDYHQAVLASFSE